MNCWVTAFRYDIVVCTNFITHAKLEYVDGEYVRIPGDPSVMREDLVKQCERQTYNLRDGDAGRKDNHTISIF